MFVLGILLAGLLVYIITTGSIVCVALRAVDLESAMFRVQLSRRIHTREASEDELTEDAVVADVTYIVDAADYKAALEAYQHLVESGVVSTGTMSTIGASDANTSVSAASSESSEPTSRMVATSRVKLSPQPGFSADIDLDPYGRRVEVQLRDGKRTIRRIVTSSGKNRR